MTFLRLLTPRLLPPRIRANIRGETCIVDLDHGGEREEKNSMINTIISAHKTIIPLKCTLRQEWGPKNQYPNEQTTPKQPNRPTIRQNEMSHFLHILTTKMTFLSTFTPILSREVLFYPELTHLFPSSTSHKQTFHSGSGFQRLNLDGGGQGSQKKSLGFLTMWEEIFACHPFFCCHAFPWKNWMVLQQRSPKNNTTITRCIVNNFFEHKDGISEQRQPHLFIGFVVPPELRRFFEHYPKKWFYSGGLWPPMAMCTWGWVSSIRSEVHQSPQQQAQYCPISFFNTPHLKFIV